MKKAFLTVAFLPICISMILGCQNSPTHKGESTIDNKRNEDTIGSQKNMNTEVSKKIEGTTRVVLGYLTNSFVADIQDPKEIKQFEDLFNGVEFTKSNSSSLQQPHLLIIFSGKNGSVGFSVDKNNIIKSDDGSYLKSRQITFEKIYSIFNEHATRKKVGLK
ncbi:MAG TPA: hypothetical protein VF941_21280 [Clostridia bacterium]